MGTPGATGPAGDTGSSGPIGLSGQKGAIGSRGKHLYLFSNLTLLSVLLSFPDSSANYCLIGTS